MNFTILKWVIGLLLVVLSSLFGVYKACELRWYTPMPIVQDFITVDAGESLTQIITELTHDTKLNEQFWWLKVWLRIKPEFAPIQVGTYRLSGEMSPDQIAALLRSGQVHQNRITLVEGETFAMWWEQIQGAQGIVMSDIQESALALALGAPSSKLEGLLLPETYYYTDNTNAKTIIARAYESMKSVVAQAWKDRDTQLPIRNDYELLILASIIEKETGRSDERSKVASVFVNRLNKQMRLQTDPTVIYGMGSRYQGRIRNADLRESTPYNTYVIFGLPPTPIAMPSAKSIQAAAHPDQTSYYYFVANGEGGHYFSKSLAEHNRAVNKYILKR